MHKNFVRVTAAVALVAGACLSTGAHALQITQNYVFGDSLNDSGSAAALTIVAPNTAFFPPSNPSIVPGAALPYNYRFSNGPVAVEYLAGLLGIAPSTPAWPAAPSPNANSNFAVGGAMTGVGPAPASLCCNYNSIIDSPSGLKAGFPAVQFTGVNNQVSLFGARLAAGDISFAPATTLFTLWAGPNDIFLALALAQSMGLNPAQTAALLQIYAANAVANLGARIGELAALGAAHFLVLNMPNLGATPAAAGTGFESALEGLSIGFNAGLHSTLDFLRANFGLDIIEFDSFGALEALIASGTFSNTTQPCFDAADVPGSLPRILAGCPGYLFFDGVHPTTDVNAILAQQLARAIPEPGSFALLAAALFALGWARRARSV